MKKKMVMALGTVAVVALLVVGGTLAWFTDEAEVTNVFTAGSVSIAINEEFEPVTDWVPGDTETKEVKFTSLGESDTYLRVKLTPTWYNVDGQEQIALGTNVLQFNWTENSDWVLSEGWYYYKDILNKDVQTSALLDSVKFLGGVTGVDYSQYQGKTLKVLVEAEAVQAENDAYKDAWNLTELPFTPFAPGI